MRSVETETRGARPPRPAATLAARPPPEDGLTISAMRRDTRPMTADSILPRRCRRLLAVPQPAAPSPSPPAATTTTSPGPRPPPPRPRPPSLRPSAHEGCEAAEPEPKDVGARQARRRSSRAPSTHVVTLETNCGDIEITLDVERATRSRPRRSPPRRAGLLRRPDLPPRRQPDPTDDFVIQGGDPLGQRQGRSRLQRRRGARRATGATRAAWWRWPRPRPRRPARRAASSTSSPAEDAGLPPDYALVGEVTGGERRVDRIAAVRSRPGDGGPLDAGRHREATLSVR